ncbi:MAG: hypothetical protein QOI61_1430 [Actinomycetota bacterium]
MTVSAREQKVAARLGEIARDRRALRNALEPGRWRAALRGYLSHAQAERWQAIARGRQQLAPHYADLPAQRGAAIYERSRSLTELGAHAKTGLRRRGCFMQPARRFGSSPVTPRQLPRRRPSIPLTDRRDNRVRDQLGILVFPHPHDLPSRSSQTLVRVGISRPVAVDLRRPPLRIPSRATAMFRTAVPKASVDEHRQSLAGKHDVRRTSQPRHRPNLHAIPKPASVQSSANTHLGRSVPPRSATKVLRPSLHMPQPRPLGSRLQQPR